MDLSARFHRALTSLIATDSGRIGLAVSGGGDSMALMHFTARSSLIENANLHVFTVDHGLRAESDAEARLVAEQASALGISYTVLTWRAPSKSQAKARDARHRLLANAAKSESVRVLLTGHTLSDNLESFLIRVRAGSGWYGLVGMRPFSASPVWPEGEGLFVARPMLAFQRAEIRQWLEAEGEIWCEDPSNENEVYERVRMRQLLSEAPELGDRIARIQDRLTLLRRARDRWLAHNLAAATIGDDTLELPLTEEIKTETLAQILSICAMIVSGTDRPARTARCINAAQQLISSDPECTPVTLTLGGTVIRKTGQSLLFRRESNRPNAQSPSDIGLRLRHISAGLTGAPPA